LLVLILIYLAIGAGLIYGAAQNRRAAAGRHARSADVLHQPRVLLIIGEIFFRTSFADPTACDSGAQKLAGSLLASEFARYRDRNGTYRLGGKHTVLVVGVR
jgi:hypothetical protein